MGQPQGLPLQARHAAARVAGAPTAPLMCARADERARHKRARKDVVMTIFRQTFIAIALLLASSAAAFALDKVKVGKAVPNSFAFSGVEVGIAAKKFEQEGLELEVSAFRGDAQLQQALTAGSIDIGFGSGPGMGFRAKGVPAVAVPAPYG